MNKLELRFEEAEHGWLPVCLDAADEKIEFITSDVPNNPVQGLVNSIWASLRGDSSEVWWHLEPDGYFFTFVPEGENVQLEVFYSADSSKNKRESKLIYKGNLQETMLVLWRGIKEFDSHGPKEPHWPPLDTDDLVKLGKKLKYESVKG